MKSPKKKVLKSHLLLKYQKKKSFQLRKRSLKSPKKKVLKSHLLLKYQKKKSFQLRKK
ncbi:hypothetical protein OMAG_000620 [Candidatus Omnitrophus magneticus]|uniref:Uncharacterized protein n=1 Tax=Candidatus Omnitrophus magneticus TaxID=1609969 RepID=A0A0F0CVC7_9BACT|nr:hypothetical protein OMAG_000620 [Candidatus Omnitrophus magneticus]